MSKLNSRVIVVIISLFALVFLYTGYRSTWHAARSDDDGGHPLTYNDNTNTDTDINNQGPAPAELPANFTLSLIISNPDGSDTSWLTTKFPTLDTVIYTNTDTDTSKSQFKGHSTLTYLTHIIKNYHTLPSISIFTHFTSQFSDVNEDILNHDAITILERLRPAHLFAHAQQGYFNLRCTLMPGCPVAHDLSQGLMKLGPTEATAHLGMAWHELFPAYGYDVRPGVVAQAAGSQFAVTKERILSVPLERWEVFREWVEKTELSDDEVARVWEFTWQYVFTGEAAWCPEMDACLCGGYGVCFGSKQRLEEWLERKTEVEGLNALYLKGEAEGKQDLQLKEKIDAKNEDIKRELEEAFKRGENNR